MADNNMNRVALHSVSFFSKERKDNADKKKQKLILLIADFAVQEGETAYVKGASSSGKTVLLKLIKQYPISQDSEILYPFQKAFDSTGHSLYLTLPPPIIPNNSLLDNILLPLSRSNLRLKHRIIEYLHLFGLERRRDDKASTLSHSQLLCIGLIRAVISLPELLLVDDYDLMMHCLDREKVWAIFAKITENNGAIVATGKDNCEGFSAYYSLLAHKDNDGAYYLNGSEPDIPANDADSQ